MGRNNRLEMLREIVKGRLEITTERFENGSRTTIYIDRAVALVTAALIIGLIVLLK